MKIGIAITTTPSRQHLYEQCLAEFQKLSPPDTPIYTHNDIYGIGIAKSKNKCIAALMAMNVDYLFLADDDVYPIKEGWHLPFIQSGLHHASVTFTHFSDGTRSKHKLLRTRNGIDYFSNGCGFLLFFTRHCIETVGGMDERYGKWGYEHGGLSARIKNAGLTDSIFLAPSGIMDYFYSHDQHKTCQSVFTQEEKRKLSANGMAIARLEKIQSNFKPYDND
jgi:hypothetical protein